MLLDGDQAATVFLSYSRGDQKRALPVIKALEAAGIKVWWDGLLEGGDTFLPTTEAALESADAVVVLWSKTSVDSHWVRDEATRGRERGCLVPLTIDGTHAPLGFRQFQTINISKWHGKAGAPEIERAIRAVHGFAGQVHAEPMPLPRQPLVSRRHLIGGGAVALVGLGGLGAWRLLIADASAAPGNSVAVLPFRNLSGDPDQDYFAEGISEQIRSNLSRNGRLLVMAPASILSLPKAELGNLKSVADKLGVAYLLEGSVRHSGTALRITARIINGDDGFEKWSSEFTRQLADIFSVQDEIAEAVAAEMAAQTAVGAKPHGKEPGGTTNIKAYDAYLRGNAYYNQRSGTAVYRLALEQYDLALREDPKFAAAHAARARVVVVLTNSSSDAASFKSAYDDALASARRAVELAPDLAAAHSTLGFVLVQGKLDLRGAAAPYAKARQLGEGDAGVLSLFSAFAAQTGRSADAETAVIRAIKLDPLNPGSYRMAAFVAYAARNWSLAIERNRKALALNPQIQQCHAFIGDSLVQMGRFAEARAAYAREPEALYRLTGEAIAAYRAGNAAASAKATERIIAAYGEASSYQQGQILAQTGQADAAIKKLLRAREIGDVGLALAYTDPMLDSLKGRADFKQLLTVLGFG
jgi:TolB-like protein/Flp pilus assembly protein TadD